MLPCRVYLYAKCTSRVTDIKINQIKQKKSAVKIGWLCWVQKILSIIQLSLFGKNGTQTLKLYQPGMCEPTTLQIQEHDFFTHQWWIDKSYNQSVRFYSRWFSVITPTVADTVLSRASFCANAVILCVFAANYSNLTSSLVLSRSDASSVTWLEFFFYKRGSWEEWPMKFTLSTYIAKYLQTDRYDINKHPEKPDLLVL